MRTEVKCPGCHRRIMDKESSVRLQTKIMDPYDPGPPNQRWSPDIYLKCWKCGSHIGIRKLE